MSSTIAQWKGWDCQFRGKSNSRLLNHLQDVDALIFFYIFTKNVGSLEEETREVTVIRQTIINQKHNIWGFSRNEQSYGNASCQSWCWGPLPLHKTGGPWYSMFHQSLHTFIINNSFSLSLRSRWGAVFTGKKIDFLIALLQPEVFSSHLSFDWFWHQLSNILFFIAFTIERFLSLSHQLRRTNRNNEGIIKPGPMHIKFYNRSLHIPLPAVCKLSKKKIK